MAESEKLWTISDILKWTEQYFKDKGVESPRLDAEVLLSTLLGKERIYLYVHFDEPLQKNELTAFREMIKKRIMHIPVAYIIGQREFMGNSFKVTPDVLIPRPDTEILVEALLERYKDRETLEFVDIGTGSGAIVLSLLKNIPQAKGWTVDISDKAIAVARENADRLDVAERVTFLQGNMLEPVIDRKFDFIVSNPPYIPDEDIKSLTAEVQNEPLLALAGGDDGLDFYHQLINAAGGLLKSDGLLALEVGIHQAQPVAEMAKQAGFNETEIIKDYAGIERVILAKK